MIRREAWTLLALLVLACSSRSTPPAAGGTSADSGLPAVPALDAAAASDTWASYASGFFTRYCVSCHDAKDATGRDYTVRANVAKDKDAMRCGLAVSQDPSWSCSAFPPAKQFPIGSGPKPSDAERDRMVAWITAGEP
jgi:hypothetical protein